MSAADPYSSRGTSRRTPFARIPRGTLYNFTARATLLRDKPYRGAVFYDHLNPTLNIGPGEVMNQESTRYGVEAMLLEPVSPMPLNLDATRTRYTGSGTQRIVDDRTDQFSLRGTYAHGGMGSTHVRLLGTRQTSASGNFNLPIQTTSSDSREASADTRLSFGAEKRFDVSSLVNLGTQDYSMSQGTLPSRKELRVLLSGRWAARRQRSDLRHHQPFKQHAGGGRHRAGRVGGRCHLALRQGYPDFRGCTRGVPSRQSARGEDLRRGRFGAVPTDDWIGSVQAGYGVRYTVRDQQRAHHRVQ